VIVWTGALLAGMAVLWVTVHGLARVRRLHRLHRRTDAARAGLESALERRAAAALAAAAVPDAAGSAPALLRAAVAAASAAGGHRPGGERESAENALGRRLAALDRSALPPVVLAELVDAEQSLTVARSVHNDAVRDTLVLRSRRLVRWLHLAGSAPWPTYFEIADARQGAAATGARTVIRETPVAPPR
jgi:hypothetical protein